MRGQVFVRDLTTDVLYFRLMRPYWTAAREFGWTGKDYSPGIDINPDALEHFMAEGVRTVRVFVGREITVYEIGAEAWKQFSESTNSVHRTGNVALYQVPWSRFKSIRVEEGSRDQKAWNAITVVESGKRARIG